MLIHNNFSKYNLPNQSHKNTTILTSNLGSFPTTRFHINQPYHFQARRGMKEKIVFLIRNVFTRKFHKIFNIEKKITFNFNFIETVSGNLPLLDRIKFLEENLNNTIVDLEFDESPEVQVIKNLPENDFQGRIFELISGSHREQLAAKIEAGNSLIEYKIHCRNTYLNFKSIVGKKQGGTYGTEKIDGVDSEKEKFILDAYAEELLAKVKIFEIKTSRTGDLKGSMKSALKDVMFNCNRDYLLLTAKMYLWIFF